MCEKKAGSNERQTYAGVVWRGAGMSHRSFARVAALLVVLLVTQLVLSPFTLYSDFGLLPACASPRGRDCAKEEAAVARARRAYETVLRVVDARRDVLEQAEDALEAARRQYVAAEEAFRQAEERAIMAEAVVESLKGSLEEALENLETALEFLEELGPLNYLKYVKAAKVILAVGILIKVAEETASFLRWRADSAKATRDTAKDAYDAARGARDAAQKAYSDMVEALVVIQDALNDAEDDLARCLDFK